jgi:subtilase family serine protease
MRKSSSWFVFIAIVIAMIATPVLRAQESLRTSRVVAQINENQLVTLGGHVVPWATRANDQGVAPDDLKLDLHMMLKRSDAQEAELQKLLADQQNRKSANFRKWLTPEEYGKKFGVSDADLAKVTAWLTAHGFTVEKVSKGNNVILFAGTSAQVKEALHTTLHQYKVRDEFHYANASNPMVPAALAPVISGFYGLNDMKPKPMHTKAKVAQVKRSANGWNVAKVKSVENGSSGNAKSDFEWTDPLFGSSWHLLAPADFATIYNVTPLYKTLDGSDQTIAIVSGSDINPQDVDRFRANFNLPPKKLNIYYAGTNPGLVPGVEGEADLDVEWSGAIAPNATVDLVVSPDVTSSIFYIVDNNLAPVMSISYGECELGLQIAGNAYFSELYKQAASQGITVLAAAGDSGSDSCDQGNSISSYGLSVSGWASTPYNVAVGGTDFPVNVLGQASDYWSSTNDQNDFHSALKYVPEAPWNDTCASPEVLAAAQTYPDWVADTTNELLCNDPNAYQFVSVVGGSGGASNCTNTDTLDPTQCTAGYSQPAWQIGVPGVPTDSRRHLPDVSFFSGDGIWSSAYMFCESDATAEGVCDITNPDDVRYNLAGGTSFASPAFAGIVALLNQKTNSWLGNINYTLYKLAATQFSDPTLKDACKADSTTGNDSCIFHDITQGGNSVPCLVGTPDNPPDGKCSVTNSSDQLGVLSGYSAGGGYDDASGLGSLNAYNLVNNWPGSLAATQTTLTLTSTNANYGMSFGGTVKVTAASGTPTGTVTLMYKDSNGKTYAGWAPNDLNNGVASVSSVQMPIGTYKVYARYGGDAVYGASASSDQSVTVSPAVTTLVLNANRTSVAETDRTQLMATIKAPSFGSSPTGSVVFTNTTTGAVIDTVQVTAYTDASTGYSYAQAMTSAGTGTLTHGSNQITATYSGDSNYLAATGSAPAIQYTGGFSIAASSSTLTLGPGANTGNTVVFTLTPSAGTLSPSSIKFTCPGTMPAGVTCQFSAPTAGSNGTVSSTLTLVLNSPLAQNSPAPVLPMGHGLTYFAMMIVGGVFVTVPRKRSAVIAMMLVLVLLTMFSFGCGGSSSKSTPVAPTMTTTLTVSNPTPALNSAVTLKATLSNSAATGNVSFFDGTNLLGSAAVSGGSASITTSSLPIGTRKLTAAYGGDSTYPAATSTPVSVDVTFTSTIMAQAINTTTGDMAQQSVTITVK